VKFSELPGIPNYPDLPYLPSQAKTVFSIKNFYLEKTFALIATDTQI